MDLTSPPTQLDENEPPVSRSHLSEQNLHTSQQAQEPRQNFLKRFQELRPTFFRRLGTWSFSVISGSIILIFGALAFIIFLWSSNGDNRVWHNIVLADWTTRSVTLASLIIRWAVAAQSGICTSMLAAIALHRYEVLLPQSAAVSTMLYLNSGPQWLTIPLARTLKTGKAFSICLVASLLSLTTILSQFTSTLLLSDLHEALTISDMQHSTFYYRLNESRVDSSDIMYRSSPWTVTKPGVYPTFAEYSETGYQHTHIHDTGVTVRGLLPIENQSLRSSLRNYSGYGALVNTRVVCVRPKYNISVGASDQSIVNDETYASVAGTVWINETAPEPYPFDPYPFDPNPWDPFTFDTRKRRAQFNCSAPLPHGREGDGPSSASVLQEWPVSLCPVGDWWARLPSDIDESNFFYYAFLVLNTTGSVTSWHDALNLNNSWNENPHEEDSEWLRISSTVEGVEFGLSLCFTTLDSIGGPISASGGQNHTEPKLGWDHFSRKYDTLNLRKSLGAVKHPDTPAVRGHLQMAKPDRQLLSDLGGDMGILSDALSKFQQNQSIFMCTHCYHSIFNDVTGTMAEVNPGFSDPFNDILRLTNRPALAIQAYITTLAGMVYYDHLQGLDIAAPATFVTFIQAILPTQWMGLKAVLVVIAVQLILVATIVATFAAVAKESLIGNAWSALAQISQSRETQEWLARSYLAEDGEVTKWMRAEEKDRVLMGIGGRSESGKLKFWRRKGK